MRRKAFHIVLTGRVQGIGFRYFVQQKAMEHSLNGWVRNKTDGSVELEVEGHEENISNFVKLLQSGTLHSRVDHMVKTELPDQPDYETFVVKY